MKVIAVSALIATLAGCSCEQPFADGSFVTHKLRGGKNLVIASSGIENYEGLCLVTARSEDGLVYNYSANELSILPKDGIQ